MTLSHTYQPPHLVDTAPLAVQYELMTKAILALIAAGHMALVLRYSQKLLRLIRVYNRLTGANVLVRRKRDMLGNSGWRRAVLRQLGGRERLRRWDEMKARFMPRLETKSAASLNGYGPVDETPAWLNTPERIAESERLKARMRNISRAAAHPNIVRDRVKTDFDGLFRLPPLPRKSRLSANIKIYTQQTISGYDWNPISFAKETGFGPACVWPREFYAAMIADGEMTEAEVPTPYSVIPDQGEACRSKAQHQRAVPVLRSRLCSPAGFGRDDKNENGGTIEEHDEPLSLKDVLSPKVWNDLFSPLPQETFLAES